MRKGIPERGGTISERDGICVSGNIEGNGQEKGKKQLERMRVSEAKSIGNESVRQAGGRLQEGKKWLKSWIIEKRTEKAGRQQSRETTTT